MYGPPTASPVGHWCTVGVDRDTTSVNGSNAPGRSSPRVTVRV